MFPIKTLTVIAATLLNPRSSPPTYVQENLDLLEKDYSNNLGPTEENMNGRKSWISEILSVLSAPLFEPFCEAWETCEYSLVEACAQLVSEQMARFACYQEDPKFLWDCEPLLELIKLHQTRNNCYSCPEVSENMPGTLDATFHEPDINLGLILNDYS